MTATAKTPELLTIKQLAERLQLSTRTIYRLAQEGTLPKPVKIGRANRWRREVLDDWLAEDCPRVAK
jgi:excisionase family DNA binding protein